MKTTFISTHAIGESVRMNIMRSQERIAEAQLELSTGRHADVGVAVGGQYASLSYLRQEREEMVVLDRSNSVLSTKLGVTQDALEAMATSAQDFTAELLSAQGPSGPSVIKAQGETRMTMLKDLLNTNFDGAYMFAGTNSGQPPMEDYFANPTPASRASVEAAFLAEFGFTATDPAVETISDTDMIAFLNGAYSDLFEDPDWGTNWSSASDTKPTVRISSTETVDGAVSANDEAFRKLASVFAAATDLGTLDLNPNTFEAMAHWLAERTGQAVQDVSVVQAQVGTVEGRIADAVDRIQTQREVLDLRIGDIEGVDAFEASARVTSLLTQIETSYAVTSRIQQLSILNFL
ncbi:MAG: flagellar hook-associated family protein [Filomicrobium sp.]